MTDDMIRPSKCLPSSDVIGGGGSAEDEDTAIMYPESGEEDECMVLKNDGIALRFSIQET